MFKNFYYSLLEYLLIIKKHIETKRSKIPPVAWKSGIKGNVLLVPGFQETWVALKTPADFLNSLGYKIFVIKEIEPNILPIKKCIKLVGNFIKENKFKDVILLAHSKGGIINRFLLTDKDVNPKIKLVINIAAPNMGSLLAYGKFHNLNELIPNSNLLKELETNEKDYRKIVNIYPKLDNHVIPNSSLFLKGAKNIKIDVVGHTRIIESPETLESIKNILSTTH